MAWTVDDSYDVNIGKEVANYPAGEITSFNPFIQSDGDLQINWKVHNAGDAAGRILKALHDDDRNKWVEDIQGYVWRRTPSMSVCETSPEYANVYGVNMPDSEWHLTFVVGHEEDGKIVLDDGRSITLRR